MIFVDSNIPMYLVGAPHPHKTDSQRLVEQLLAGGERLVTDAEVFQEILHRYTAIERRDAIQPAFEVLTAIVDEVFPIDLSTVERARALLLANSRASARDALHVAIMGTYRMTDILTFDAGFDGFPGVRRVRV